MNILGVEVENNKLTPAETKEFISYSWKNCKIKIVTIKLLAFRMLITYFFSYSDMLYYK